MKSVGSMLHDVRVQRGIHLEDVEKATHIRKKFLEAIEQDNYILIPSLAYAKGFVKNYSEFLGLNSETTLAFFRRQLKDTPKHTLLPKKTLDSNQPFFSLTPSRFLTLLLGLCVVIFISYFIVQLRNLQTTPRITIDQPKEGAIVEERKIDILGTTSPDATVTVNGISVLVRSDGKFFDQVQLEPGVNTITITATSRFGKSTTVVRKVGLKQ